MELRQPKTWKMFRFFRQLLAFFGVHQMALSLFRFIAALGRTQIVANTLGTFTLLLVFVLGGFIVAKGQCFVSFCYGLSWLFLQHWCHISNGKGDRGALFMWLYHMSDNLINHLFLLLPQMILNHGWYGDIMLLQWCMDKMRLSSMNFLMTDGVR